MRPSSARPRTRALAPVVTGAAAGITVAAVVRKGGFYWPDYVVLPGLMAALAVLSAGRLRPLERRIVVALAAFVAWWLVAGFGWGVPQRALQLAGTTVGFGASLLLGARLDHHQRKVLQHCVVALGVGVASLGLIGLVMHVYPLAMPHEDLWRLAGTLTYSNAAGLVLALTLPLALVLDHVDDRWRRAALFLIVTGLLATLSRGALLAALIPLPLLGRRRLAAALWPALLALATALILLATVSPGRSEPCLEAGPGGCAVFGPEQLVASLALGAGLAAAVCIAGSFRPRPHHAVLAVGAVALVVAASGALRSSLAIRVDPTGVDSRMKAWSAAVAELVERPLGGVGPERDLVINHGREVTHFAHNEYLQVGAGAGLVGLALLATVMVSLGHAALSNSDPRARAALTSLLVLAIGGLFDFGWHVPAIALTAGWIAALSLAGDDEEDDDETCFDAGGGRHDRSPPHGAAAAGGQGGGSG